MIVLETGFAEKRSKLKKYPTFSVIIPAYNEEDSIKDTIKSVLNLDYPKEKLEIVVINDGSKDRTGKIVEELARENKGRNIKLINQINQGKAKSLNNGLKIINGEFFACLDADSIINSDALKKMLAVFQENGKELAIVTPSMRIRDPKTILQKFQRLEYLMSVTLARFRSKLDCAHVAPGPFSVYRTEYITKMGGFDENNLTEDQEIAYRAQKNHYKILQCSDAIVYTLCPPNLKELYKQRNRWFKGSLFNVIKYRSLMFNKNYAHFGMLQMPMNLFTFFAGIAAIVFLFEFTIQPILKQIYNLYLIDFDILPLLRNMDITFNLTNVQFAKFFVISTVFMLTMAWFYISHFSTNEKVAKHGALYFIPYFLIYYLFLSLISVIVVIEVLGGKFQKW